MADIAVVHLVRAKNGLQPLRNFLDSYARHQSGMRHDLLIVFKGFINTDATREHQAFLKPFNHKMAFISDFGFDLRAYLIVAKRFQYSHFCFLNSFSLLLGDNWLGKFFLLADQPSVGVVAATGSYESMYSNRLLHRPAGGLGARVSHALGQRMRNFLFHPFPNYHLRTNAFMISRVLMLKVWQRHILTKRGAYLFESGKNNFTQRILKLGLKALIVGNDGRGYEKEDWFRSNTFRQSQQENLLVSDNQSRQYANADFSSRKHLSQLAWGQFANPSPPKQD